MLIPSAPQDRLKSTAAGSLCPHQRPSSVSFLLAGNMLDSSPHVNQPYECSQPSPGRCILQGQCYPFHNARPATEAPRAILRLPILFPADTVRSALWTLFSLLGTDFYLGPPPSLCIFLSFKNPHKKDGIKESTRERETDKEKHRKPAREPI